MEKDSVLVTHFFFSSQLRFMSHLMCYIFSYISNYITIFILTEQLESTHLSPLNNNWYSVHNFTPEIRDSWSFVTKVNDH